MSKLDCFQAVWLADFEYSAPPGERPTPLCLVARELRSGRLLRLWQNELTAAPYPLGKESLFVAYYASAELGCHLALGWPMPARVLDLFAEFRCVTNGLPTPCGAGLLGAMTYHGIDGIAATEKETMRALAMRGGEYTDAERLALLEYCQTDVDALAKLLPAMLPKIDLPRALLRGQYMAAAAAIEHNGTPIDCEALEALRSNWSRIQAQLVREVDKDFGVYVPTGSTLDETTTAGAAIVEMAAANGIDAHRLAEAADYLRRERCEALAEHSTAVEAARKATGLSINRIGKWEDAGRDHTTWPGLDVKARELAGAYPALGIGRGYTSETGFDATDYPGQLWELLRREPTHKPRRDDPEILRRAAELVATANEQDYAGPLTFSTARWAAWLTAHNLPWPQLESGALDLSDDAFREMANRYPIVRPIRELRVTLSQMRLNDLAVGHDGRNRCLLSAFRATTGRNQPSNSRFIFGPSCWLRALIKPPPGRAVAYIDWQQQEFGIAAALSGDVAMRDAYASGDPYLAFAKQAGAAPPEATKQSHKAVRDQFKVCALAVQYGMAERSLAASLGASEAKARELLALHKQTYPHFWRWSQAAVDHAMLLGYLYTVFGWRVHVGQQSNGRSLANFPCQANGAEMLRLACCLATERGIQVCAPIHDALLIEAAEAEIAEAVEACQAAMLEASRIVLSGFELRTDATIVGPGERYLDPRGVAMWEQVSSILERSKGLAPAHTLDRF